MPAPSITDIITGKDVTVNGVNQLGRIKIAHTVEANPIFHSAGKGGAERAEGNVDFTGFYWAWGHTPATFPNSAFALSFELNGSGGGLQCSDVLCLGIEIVVPTYDPRQQNGVYHIVHFGARGTDLSAGADIAADTVYGEIKTNKGMYCSFGVDPASLTAQTNTMNMHLTIQALTERVVTSETAGVYTRPTGSIDWQFKYRRAINSMALLPASNAVGRLRMYVEAAKYWQLDYGRIVGREGLFDHESGEVLGADMTIAKAHADGVTGISDGAVGSIIDPTPTTKWS